MRRLRRAAGLTAAALAIGAAGAAADELAFYVPPSPLPAGKPGSVLRSEPLTGAARIAGVTRQVRVLYRSTDGAGRAIAVSGTVAFPAGRPPRGGWPVLSWAHGTTGVADRCAPSRDDSPLHDPGYDYGRAAHAIVAAFARRGFVVAQTDYEGLGTPGPHPYLVGPSEARGVIDIVGAARALDRRVGRTWVAAGHSQGGQAALFAAALAGRRAPELHLAGVDALAAASSMAGWVHFMPQMRWPIRLNGLFPYVLAGARTVDPAIDPLRVLSPTAAAFWPLVDTGCIQDLIERTSFAGLQPGTIVAPGVSLAPVERVLTANDPRNLRLRVPVRLQQGERDGLVTLYVAFYPLYSRLVNRGAPLTYRLYPRADHTGVLRDGLADAVAWTAARAGLPPRPAR